MGSAKVTIYPGGMSGGFAAPPGRGGGRRGQVNGWTRGAARRLVSFLWSVNPDLLGDDGWAITLTVGETPETATEWEHARSLFLQRCRDLGVTRYQWCTEWTALGRPHTHMAVYGPGRLDVALLLAWLDIADSHGWPVATKAQHIVPIVGATGWLQYVSKHAARGVVHYQREGAPEGWTKTGRLWGVGGDWPTEEETVIEMGVAQFALFRDLVHDWLLADMVRREVPPELVAECEARWADPEHGNAHGLSGWIPGDVAYSMALAAIDAVPADHPWEN